MLGALQQYLCPVRGLCGADSTRAEEPFAAPSPMNQIMLSSTGLGCISKLVNHCTYSEMMTQVVDVSEDRVSTS